MFICPAVPLGKPLEARSTSRWDDALDTDEGWAKYNRHYWLRDYRAFLEFFFSQMFTEPHSTKPIEDCVSWGLDTSPETLVAHRLRQGSRSRRACASWPARLRCPVLVIQGSEDAITGRPAGSRSAEATGASWSCSRDPVTAPHVRDPVKVNLLLREFAAPARRAAHAGPARSRAASGRCTSRPRSGSGTPSATRPSPTSCGGSHPDLEIDWLAQHPVTKVLEARGERIHPASAQLANESAHIESESAEHDLHCFQAIRRMDEILLANFMVFHDLVRERDYDLWIGDEAWELDYYLHENPEQKSAAYVWLTDFVGWLPMEDGGDREAYVTADYNAEMIEHIARFPRVRDRAVFVGNADDIVPAYFGPGLPADPRLDRARTTTSRATSPGFDPRDARRPRGAPGLPRRRARLHRDRRRVRRRSPPAAARDRRIPGGEGARARACG